MSEVITTLWSLDAGFDKYIPLHSETIQKNKRTFFIADRDIGLAIAIQISGIYFHTNSRIVIYQGWNKGHTFVTSINFKPVEHGRICLKIFSLWSVTSACR